MNGLTFIGTGQVKYICDPSQHESQYPHLNLQDFNSPEAIQRFRERLHAMELAATITQSIVGKSSQMEAEEKSMMDKFAKSLMVRRDSGKSKDEPQKRNLLGPQGSFPKRTIDFAIVGVGEIIGMQC